MAAVLAVGAIAPSANAETARWLIKPQYRAVMPMGANNLYKVKQTMKSGVVAPDGRTVVAIAYDSITPFSEGLALILNGTPEGKMRLVGILSEDGVVSNVSDELYTDQFPLFSEGLLPVANRSGKVGYVDRNGREIVPFKFSNPHPFSNGLAAVSKPKGGILSKAVSAVGADGLVGNDKIYYINQFGKELKLPREIGDIYLGTTFKDGEALVMNKDRQCFIINPMGTMLRMEPLAALTFDERYCLVKPDETTAATSTTPLNAMTTYQEGQLYGYKVGDRVMIPAQFTAANNFTDGHAIAAKNRAVGVLDLISGNVEVNVKRGTATPTDNSVESAIIDVTVPRGLANMNVTADAYDSANKLAATVQGAANETGRHSLPIMLPKGDRMIRVSVDGIEVWNSTMKPEVKQVEQSGSSDIEISFSTTRAKANAKDAAAIGVTISNRGSKTFTGAVSATGASVSPKRVTIKAGGKATVNLYFSKVTKSETRSVTVTVGDESESRKITLEPFFNL